MTNVQKQLTGEFIFKILNDGIYHCINRDYSGTPVELCDIFGVVVPDMVQFLRIRNFSGNYQLEFRDYGGSIRVNIYEYK